MCLRAVHVGILCQEGRILDQIDIVQVDLVGVIFKLMQQTICLHIVFIVRGIVAFEILLAREDIDIDVFVERIDIVDRLCLQFKIAVRGHIDVHRAAIGQHRQDHVDQNDRRDDQRRDTDRGRAAAGVARGDKIPEAFLLSGGLF